MVVSQFEMFFFVLFPGRSIRPLNFPLLSFHMAQLRPGHGPGQTKSSGMVRKATDWPTTHCLKPIGLQGGWTGWQVNPGFPVQSRSIH